MGFEEKMRGLVEGQDKGIAGANLIGIHRAMETLLNDMKAKHNAVNAQLDADAGVTDDDYASNHDITLADIDLDTLSQG